MFRQIIQKIKCQYHYKNDQKGIIRRYLNEKENWDIHLTYCKEYIIESLPKGKLDKIAILGSGWLLDIPINQLAEICNEIHFFDIHHPAAIRHKYRNFPNIIFKQVDLTQGLAFKLMGIKTKDAFMMMVKNYQSTLAFSDFDYVVSLNLLNQLDILLFDVTNTNLLNFSEEQLIEMRKHIQKQHLECLPREKSCVITDIEEFSYNDKNQLQSNKPLVYIDLPQTEFSKYWIWDFDTKQKYRKKRITRFKVMATRF